jgi:hypothetical protein
MELVQGFVQELPVWNQRLHRRLPLLVAEQVDAAAVVVVAAAAVSAVDRADILAAEALAAADAGYEAAAADGGKEVEEESH